LFKDSTKLSPSHQQCTLDEAFLVLSLPHSATVLHMAKLRTFAPLQIPALRHCSIAKELRWPVERLIFRKKTFMFFRLLKAVKGDFLFFIKLFSIIAQFGTLLV
jgi:hypothetical protein